MTYPDKDLFIESGNSFQCLHKKKIASSVLLSDIILSFQGY